MKRKLGTGADQITSVRTGNPLPKRYRGAGPPPITPRQKSPTRETCIRRDRITSVRTGNSRGGPVPAILIYNQLHGGTGRRFRPGERGKQGRSPRIARNVWREGWLPTAFQSAKEKVYGRRQTALHDRTGTLQAGRIPGRRTEHKLDGQTTGVFTSEYLQ